MPIVVSPAIPVVSSISTSGTVGTTIIDTIKVIEHAARRCGRSPSSLTPEELDTAKDNLYLILCALTNRGINLWCVEQEIIPLQLNKKTYTLPNGTISVLNSVYRTSVRLATTALTLTGGASCTAQFAAATAVKTIGMKFVSAQDLTLIVESSVDGASWSTEFTPGAISVTAGWLWYDVDPAMNNVYIRVRETTGAALTMSDMLLANTNSDTPIEDMSRDTYAGQSNKNNAGRPSNYLFDKQLIPSMTFWPVPNDDTAQVLIWRERQVQDVGGLAQVLDIPNRWFESVIWSLSKNLSFELAGVPPDRITLCIQQAADALVDAEIGESDGAPIFLGPNISGYNR